MSIRIDTPLDWPNHLVRTPRGRQSNLHGFSPSLTIEDALRYAEDEIAPFYPTLAVVSTYIEHFNSDRLRKIEGANPAIALKLKCESGIFHLGCDRWLTPQHNLYAMAMTLRQLRQIDGYGCLGIAELLALTMPRATQATTNADSVLAAALEPWRTALGLGPTATLEDANTLYRARAKAIGEHDPERLALLNDAIEQARKALS